MPGHSSLAKPLRAPGLWISVPCHSLCVFVRKKYRLQLLSPTLLIHQMISFQLAQFLGKFLSYLLFLFAVSLISTAVLNNLKLKKFSLFFQLTVNHMKWNSKWNQDRTIKKLKNEIVYLFLHLFFLSFLPSSFLAPLPSFALPFIHPATNSFIASLVILSDREYFL